MQGLPERSGGLLLFLLCCFAPVRGAEQAEQSGTGYLVSSWQRAVCSFDRSKSTQLIRQQI